jgi:hypothetical protein
MAATVFVGYEIKLLVQIQAVKMFFQKKSR